jgi:DNA repair photolyase
MQSIYEPKGRAFEYCERAVNLYRGCSHRCVYCYAPNALHMHREDFTTVLPRPGVLESLAKDAPKHAGREVLMCFTTDPYSPGADGTTREAIKILQASGCIVVILTKGGRRSAADLDILRPGIDKYGATLTFARDADSLAWEPGAALPSERLEVLAEAKRRGIYTWASFEPVIDPEQTLELIAAVAGVVDLCKIGRWNHDARAKEIDWPSFTRRAVDLCRKQGSAYKLKADIAAFAPAA